MNDETKPTEPAVESEKEETLDDLYKEFNVEAEAEEFEAKPEVTTPTPEPEETFYEQPNAAIMEKLSDVESKLSDFQKQQQEAQITKDIQQAVGILSKKIEGVPPKALEIHLEMKASEDAKFKRLWDNRNSNPQAWDRALNLFSKEVAETFNVKQDPQLTENQRAVAQSQNAMASTNNPDPNNEWDVDSDEFQHKWGQLTRG